MRIQKRFHAKIVTAALALSFVLFGTSKMAAAQDTPGLADLIKGLKVLSGTTTAMPFPVDINNDRQFGQEELAYIFQVIAGLRQMGQFDNGITVSGTVKDVADHSVPDEQISVELRADANNNDIYEASEVFSAQTDDNGFFALTIPEALFIKRITMHTRAPGYSEFIKTFENISTSFSLTAEVSKGEFSEIDISGISVSPARASGRVTLDTDKTVTMKVFQNKITERQAARISPRFGGSGSQVNENELLSVTFPLRGMDVPAGSDKVYANAAYLDSVNNPDMMPGDFEAEGEGETPTDILKTYAASMIKVYDENGNELMTDTTDRSNPIKIKIAIPWEAYETLEDENDQTADTVEIGLYYYDEAAEIWKLHRNADNSPAYGHLEDNFGNVLTREDLVQLQDVELDTDGKFVKTAYAPAGADSSEITIYNVGTVHHFTIYNSDKAGSTVSLNIGLTGQDGNPTNAKARYRKIRGSWWTDYDKRTGKKRRSVQAYRPEQIDNAVGKLLSNNKEERDQWLRYILEKNDPALLQAITEGIRQYALKNREGWSNEVNDLSRGISAIFNNQEVTNAIINTNDPIDCSQSPDLCKGIVAQAAEEVAKASDAKKAVAFLMEVAVGAYNPGQLDFEYALDKGIGMMDVAVNTGNAVRNLGSIPSLVNTAKQLRDDIKALYDQEGNPPAAGTDAWNTYFDKTYQLQQTVANIKKQAQSLGSGLGRVAPRIAAAEAPPQTENGLAQIKEEMLWDYEDVGGVLYGANRFGRFKWGYYRDDNFTETTPPGGLVGGGEIGVFEYYNGSQWVILPGRSSTGVDAAFAPVPNVLSWGDGSPAQPAANLGDWMIDTSPNVQVTGSIVDKNGQALTNGTKIPIYVGSDVLHPDASGLIRGTVSILDESVTVTIPGLFNQQFPVANNSLNVGNIVVEDSVIFNSDYSNGVTLAKNIGLQINASAFALSGAAVSYNFKLYSGYYWWWTPEQTPAMEVNNATGLFAINEGFSAVGTYELVVTATGDTFLSDQTKPVSKMTIRIQVVNQPPVINTVAVMPENAEVGDAVTVSMDATDPDGDDDIRYRQVSATCKMDDGSQAWLGSTQGEDSEGNPVWTVNTENYALYRQLTGDISCTVNAYVYDTSWGYASGQDSFTLEARSVAPEAYTWISDKYMVSYPMSISPGWAWFSDKNNDIDHYELDCGLGGSVVRSDQPIRDVDPNTPGDQVCVYDPAAAGGETGPFTFSYKAVDSQGNEKEIRSDVTLLQPITLGVVFPEDLDVPEPDASGNIVVALPQPDEQGNRSFALGVNADSPNGNLTFFKYSVRYQPAYAYWWSYLVYETEGPLGDGASSESVPVTIDRPGKYYVFARAQDTAGMYAGYSKTFYVTADFDYRLKLNNQYVEQQKPWYLSTDTLSFGIESIGDFPDGFSGGYQWDILNADGSPFASGGTGSEFSRALPEGTYIIRLTLVNTADPVPNPVVKESRVTVYAALSPTIVSNYVYPVQQGVVALGDLYTLTANITLPEEVQLKNASWRITKSDFSSAESMYSAAGANGLLERTYKFNTVGSYMVWVSIEDSRGVVGNAMSSFQVQEYPPVIDSLTADKLTGPPPLTVNLTAAAHDPDGEIVNHIWKVTGQYTGASGQTVYLNETRIQSTGDPGSFAYAFSHEGTYKVSLIVEDNSGRKSAASEKTVTVAYQSPVIESLTADPESGQPPLEVDFTAIASDADGTVATYAWDVDADGVIEQSGPSNTFAWTFNALGNHPVKLTVTDSQGKTAVRTKTIVVYDETSGVIFSFKEIRADGLGPDIDFAAMNDFQFQEMFGKFAQTGYDEVTFLRENGRDFTNPIVGMLGFDGFYSDSWCNPMQYLAKINTPGAYGIGINFFDPDDPGVTLNFPPQYTRAAVIYSGNAQTYGIYSTINPAGAVVLNPSRNNMNQQGAINILALLGTEVVNGTHCKTTYMGFISGTGSSFTLNDATQIQGKALHLPDGLTLSDLTMTINGIPISTSEWGLGHLPKDETGKYLIPVIPGANYALLIKKSTNQFYTLRYTSDEIAASGDTLAIDPGVFQTTTLNLANLPGSGNITLTFSGPKGMAVSSFYLTGTETSLADIPKLADSADIEILTSKYYKKTTVSQLTGTIDFSTLVETSLTTPAISVDETQKTVTVSYTSQAPVALVNVLVSYDLGRTKQFSFITDQTKTSFTFSYSIPEFSIVQHWGGTLPCPATDDIQSVTATVTAMQPTDSYDDTLRTLFEHLGFPQWSINDFLGEGRVDEYVTIQGTWPVP